MAKLSFQFFKVIFFFLDTCFENDIGFTGEAKIYSPQSTADLCQKRCQFYDEWCDFWTWKPEGSKIIDPNSGVHYNCFMYMLGWQGWDVSGRKSVVGVTSGPKFCD